MKTECSVGWSIRTECSVDWSIRTECYSWLKHKDGMLQLAEAWGRNVTVGWSMKTECSVGWSMRTGPWDRSNGWHREPAQLLQPATRDHRSNSSSMRMMCKGWRLSDELHSSSSCKQWRTQWSLTHEFFLTTANLAAIESPASALLYPTTTSAPGACVNRSTEPRSWLRDAQRLLRRLGSATRRG